MGKTDQTNHVLKWI